MVIELPLHRPPRPIQSFDAHYNRAENLMPHEPLDMPLRMPLPTRPWYRRAWTYVKGLP
jgi:hypothetical protein